MAAAPHELRDSSQAARTAVALLASSPSILAKVAPYVSSGPSGRQVDWPAVARLAAASVLAPTEGAFLGVCAELAGHLPEGTSSEDAFGARWDAMDGQHQAMVASVLMQSAQSKRADEDAVLQRLGLAPAQPLPRGGKAVRVRLGPDVPAVVGDALGRERVGYADGLSDHEIWLRGRGVWRMQADRVLTSQYLLIAHLGIVRMVGTIDGVTIHGDRVAIIGRPLGEHSLVGQADPLDNASQNPVAYGDLDEPAAPDGH